MLQKTYRLLDKIRSTIIVSVLSFEIVLCLIQIILRYFTNNDIRPFAWGDEIIRLSSIWVAFLAASIGVRESSHLSVEFFLNKLLSRKVILAVKRLAGIIVLTVLALMVYYGFSRVKANIPASLQNLPISMAWFYAAIPIGSIYLFIDYLLILIYGRHPFSRLDDKAETVKEAG
jgi:TRAP-type C4-dicarboxylate transport system permease small subunit